jgi:sulfotransferase family protein
MVMRMLEKGGLPVLVDGIRTPNDDNPKGYYEFERVKKLPEGDSAWLPDAQGKAVKIIAALLQHLPDTYTYKVLFMRRKMDEILASQRRMLERRGEDPDAIDDAEMARLFGAHVAQVRKWMDQQSYVTYLDVDYNEVLADPVRCLAQVGDFLELPLDLEAMTAVVDPTLYRQRA